MLIYSVGDRVGGGRGVSVYIVLINGIIVFKYVVIFLVRFEVDLKRKKGGKRKLIIFGVSVGVCGFLFFCCLKYLK